ncbi:MAG: hypothetical protein JWL83_3331 [Actinomycetia bacterium]|nr:hypothetical protein [Actinomycetes bacterium]
MGKRIAVALTVIVATATACSSSHTTTASTQPGATSTGNSTSQSAGPLNVGKASVPDHITAAGVTPPHGRTYTPPKSIAGNCSADVTDALQAWFDSVPDGSTVSLPAHACYRIEGTVMLEDRHDLLLDGHGATLQAKTAGAGKKRDRNRCQLVLRSSSNITVQDLIVRGANPHAGTSKAAYVADLEAQHAFKLSGDDGVFLDRVQAYDTYGDFVNIAGRKGTPSKNITVARSTFDRSGRQGISFTKSEDVLIVGNEIGNVARSLFDIELDKKTSSARRIRIVANTTGPVRNFWLANKGAGVDVGDVTVTGNVTREASGGGVFVFGPLAGKRGPFTFADNVFQVTGRVSDEGSRGVFYFRNTDHVTIRHNEVHAPPDRKMPAVELHASSDATIAGNKFVGTAKPVLADTASKNVKAS